MANVLVVDDEPDVLDALARALRLAGHSVQKTTDATKALALCEDHSFDVVVLDYIMPTVSGVELLNRIREIQPAIRSVIVSGKMDSTVSEEAIVSELKDRIEADRYFHKPLDNEKLIDAVSELLAASGARSWRDLAERNINAKKTRATVKTTERALNRLRGNKKR